MAKGLTQWDLASLTGVHYSYIGKIESAAGRGPSRSLVVKLAEVLDADRDELLHLAGKNDPEMDELKRMLREARQEIKGLREQLEARQEGKAG
jgi:transcriptional regulator with XRE-family HTH domain